MPDTFGPRISYTNVDRFGIFGMRDIQIGFNEPLSLDSVVINNFQLFKSGNVIEPLSLELNDNDQLVKLNYDLLYPGNYELVINSPGISDRVGNVMGSETFTKPF